MLIDNVPLHHGTEVHMRQLRRVDARYDGQVWRPSALGCLLREESTSSGAGALDACTEVHGLLHCELCQVRVHLQDTSPGPSHKHHPCATVVCAQASLAMAVKGPLQQWHRTSSSRSFCSAQRVVCNPIIVTDESAVRPVMTKQ